MFTVRFREIILLFLSALILLAVFNFKLFFNQAILFYIFYYCSQYFFGLLFFAFLLYTLIKIIIPTVKLIIEDKDGKKLREVTESVKYLMFLFLVLLSGCVIIGILIDKLSATERLSKIIWSSGFLVGLDRFLFGKDILFLFSKIIGDTFGKVLLWFYGSFPLVGVCFALILFLKDRRLAERFIFFFFTVIFLSMTVWYFLPALNPLNFYVNNILHVSPPIEISSQLKNYSPASPLSDYQKSFYYDYGKNKFLDITTFPSTHASISFGVIIFGFLLWPWSLLFSVPWFLLEMLGALYSGQHYLVDLIFGVFFSAAAFYFSGIWKYLRNYIIKQYGKEKILRFFSKR